jgi:hypothetical protein
MIGSPMDACGFVNLAERFPDRMVVTYDSRGTTNAIWPVGNRRLTTYDSA